MLLLRDADEMWHQIINRSCLSVSFTSLDVLYSPTVQQTGQYIISHPERNDGWVGGAGVVKAGRGQEGEGHESGVTLHRIYSLCTISD